MKVAIIAAMHEECDFFRQAFDQACHSKHLNMQVSLTDWQGHEVCLIESGIGKVNATLAAQHALSAFQADLVINTGSAGGIKTGAQIGDFVIADCVCHHDLDISPIGFKRGELPGLPVYYPADSSINESLFSLCQEMRFTAHHGHIATADSFVYRSDQLDVIKAHFEGVVACEMEAAAVAQVCHLHDKPFVMIRNLSDIAGEHAPVNFQQYIVEAGKKSSALVIQLLSGLNVSS